MEKRTLKTASKNTRIAKKARHSTSGKASFLPSGTANLPKSGGRSDTYKPSGILQGMVSMSSAVARRNFSNLVDEAKVNPVVVTRNNHARVVVISAERFEMEQVQKLLKVRQGIASGIRDLSEGRTVTTQTLRQQLGLEITV